MPQLDCVGSCGATNAIVGLAAFYWTLSRLLGWTPQSMSSRGASSGAGIVQALVACLSPDQVLDLALVKNFSQYVPFAESATAWQKLRASLAYQVAEGISPWATEGPMRSEPLGELIDSFLRGPWPDDLWIIGADKDGFPVKFCKKGIERWKPGGFWESLSPKPPPVSLAVRASCSIPMLFAPVQVPLADGKVLLVWDGAFTRKGSIFGLCPVEVPLNCWNAQAANVLAFDVTNDPYYRGLTGLVRRFVRRSVWGIEDLPWPAEARDVIRVAPPMPYSALQLGLTPDQKWQLVAATVHATTRTTIERNLLPEKEHPKAQRLLGALRPFLRRPLNPCRSRGFSRDLRRVLGAYGFSLCA